MLISVSDTGWFECLDSEYQPLVLIVSNHLVRRRFWHPILIPLLLTQYLASAYRFCYPSAFKGFQLTCKSASKSCHCPLWQVLRSHHKASKGVRVSGLEKNVTPQPLFKGQSVIPFGTPSLNISNKLKRTSKELKSYPVHPWITPQFTVSVYQLFSCYFPFKTNLFPIANHPVQ